MIKNPQSSFLSRDESDNTPGGKANRHSLITTPKNEPYRGSYNSTNPTSRVSKVEEKFNKKDKHLMDNGFDVLEE